MNTLIKATGGELIRPGTTSSFEGISIDSRSLQKGQLFWCIRGDRFDGHDFIGKAVDAGASGVVLSDSGRAVAADSAFYVQVPDTLRALQDLANHHRRTSSARVIGITGTNGKSTTKEMVGAVVSKQFSTLKSRGNLNNHIGLPLNLLDLEPHHEIAVLEMGMSDRGEIARLAEIAEPEIGLITNISEAHLVHLKTVRDVQQAKGELFRALPESGIALANADDPLVMELAGDLKCRVIRFGFSENADVRVTAVKSLADKGTEFQLTLRGKTVPVLLPVLGRCNVSNAAGAAAAGLALDIPIEQIAEALSTVELMGQRIEVKRQRGLILLNDSYNANPRSMEEALKTFHDLQVAGRKFCVLGDMLELGDREIPAHQELGRQVAAGGFEYLVTVGSRALQAAEAAREAGMNAEKISACSTHEDAASWLIHHVQEQDALLFKGSRGARMERVLELLLEAN